MAEKLKDTEKIKQMLKAGKTEYIDPDSDYRYTLYTCCPNEGYECAAKRFEREGMDYVVRVGRITKVVFTCPICSNVFSAEPEELFLM